MKIENLEVFCLVVEEGSINKASRKKYLTQPAVTRQIHQIEKVYDTLLFEREKGKLTLSESGKVLYPIAKKIVNDFAQSLAIINESKVKGSFALNIGASLTIGEYLLPKILGEFKKDFPEIEVTLKIGSTPLILKQLKKDEIHIALVEGEVEGGEYKVKRFAEDEVVVVCSANHKWKDWEKVRIEEVMVEKIIWREENSGIRIVVEDILKNNQVFEQLKIYMEFGSTQAIKGAVEENIGISILSKLTLEKEIKEGSLKALSIEGIDFKRNLWVVQKKEYITKGVVKEFRNYVFQRIGLD
ncbi:LysR family transcriptional regulator [Bacillus sp. ISL-4]|uniref:LysR family transcriptional regulator n=1 Tax=Bacillus sp. ISL-4 TaxID=2819125 RepID=UPI001BEAB151|nr:LysR family transcriptional regulator [Bacillus sp. ISL-4]MBT2667279.1 LysR family transcriptional regulator [Bacillus sp. ISL-4]MBT2670585.1 LysR family transcriptional regulator [Streptomyces sp. ISL-14]